jgi:hypothetical protein
MSKSSEPAVRPVKESLASTLEAALDRIGNLEKTLLPLLAMMFPGVAPYVPAALLVTGAADAVVKSMDGVDDHASAIASIAAVTSPPAEEKANGTS